MNTLELFHPLTARWFAGSLGTPTAVQDAAWPEIAAGRHTLVSAPTGTGKTLSAFLVFIDRLLDEARRGELPQQLQLIYISPLKSLAGDIRENLRRPLEGIWREEHGGSSFPGDKPGGLDIMIRTGDTPQNERRRMIKTPPHILITTPESLYLMLTAKSSQGVLKTARWIIIDELHALIDTKRGAHLMLSIARLDKLCGKPLQRVGLSATLEPLSLAAEYLAPDEVAIAAPKMRKNVELRVTSPLTGVRQVKKDPVWQEVARAVFEHCEGTRSVIAFVEGRAYAEKLAYYVNQIAGDGFARTHHGSLSKEQRYEVEHALRGGSLRLLCATSSMELGIDVGDVDQVFQIGTPRSISSTMQRLGRAGHNPNRTSVMHIFPRAAAESLYSGLAAEVVRQGGVEHAHPPRLCLDVLAQHLVSMAADGGYAVDDVLAILPRAYPFREVTADDIRAVLRMLAGDEEHERDIPSRPRLLYDRIHDRVEGDPYSRMLAVSAGGTIPDKGLYAVRTMDGVRLGELDEEFVFEARKGDKFLLGTFGWQISDIKKDTVVVVPSTTSGARPPFWKGDIKGRRMKTGIAYGQIFRMLADASESGKLLDALQHLGLDEVASRDAEDLLKRQLAATGMLADDRTLLVEHYKDEAGNHQMMVHSVFGRQVNEPLSILAAEAAKRITGSNINFVADDDGILLFPYADCPMPERLLQQIAPEMAEGVLSAALPATPVYNMAFRYNAARALMTGIRKASRQPLWIQRMRSAEMLDSLVRKPDHPLVRETRRECLEDYWDLPGVLTVLHGIRAGTIRVTELSLEVPSPLSMPLRRQTEASMMYDYTPTPVGIRVAAQEELSRASMIAPEREHLEQAAQRAKLPENESQLHSLLMIEGDLAAGELAVPFEWLEALERVERACYIEPGLWIAAEHVEEYKVALIDKDPQKREHIVRRLLRYRGAQSAERVAERYLWAEEEAAAVLDALCKSGSLVEYEGLYYHGELFDRAQRETVRARRRQIRTLPPERYAALLASRVRVTAPKEEQLEAALSALSGVPFPAAAWESVLLPARVAGYRPELLDALLAKGKLFWRMGPDGDISFHTYDGIDWDADMAEAAAGLGGEEKVVFDALIKRGATFAHGLAGLLGGLPPTEPLMRLAELGLATADSFVPVRQWIDHEKQNGQPTRQKVKARVMALTTGRWELARPLRALPVEERLERAFTRSAILCRETVLGLNWAEAMQTLRLWEYTGRARRGYFIEGMSGMQFILDRSFAGIMAALEQPDDRIIWLAASDPAQPWGKQLTHKAGRAFLNVPGTAVALQAGMPVAVFELQGKVLRVLEQELPGEALQVFAQEFHARRIFSTLRRLTVKQYPPETADALRFAGFEPEMQDFVLYRNL